MSFQVGDQVTRQVHDGPRQGVVTGVLRHGFNDHYYVRTGGGMVHCDPERRLRLLHG
jgi:hypothetical protein